MCSHWGLCSVIYWLSSDWMRFPKCFPLINLSHLFFWGCIGAFFYVSIGARFQALAIYDSAWTLHSCLFRIPWFARSKRLGFFFSHLPGDTHSPAQVCSLLNPQICQSFSKFPMDFSFTRFKVWARFLFAQQASTPQVSVMVNNCLLLFLTNALWIKGLTEKLWVRSNKGKSCE